MEKIEPVPITEICLNITDNCNLKCQHCFVQQKPNKMSYKIAEDTMEWLIKNAKKRGLDKRPHCGFFGGEPLLEWNSIIVPIVEKYKGKINFGLTTNGVLLSEDKLKFMKDNNISLLFSCDGDKYSQDANRPLKNGESSFEAIKDIISLIPKYFPETTFRSTISKKTCGKIMDNINFAMSQGFKMMFLIPNFFETSWTKEDLATIAIQMRTYSLYFINCFKEDKIPFEIYPLMQAFNKIHRIIAHQKNGTKAEKSLEKCGLGLGGYASINYKGDIFTCQEVDSRNNDNELFHIGNIYTGTDQNKIDKLINLYLSKDFSCAFCKECRLKLTCPNENCIINNYILNKDIHKANPIICWWFDLLLGEALFICKILGEQKNQKFKKYFYDMRGLYNDRNS